MEDGILFNVDTYLGILRQQVGGTNQKTMGCGTDDDILVTQNGNVTEGVAGGGSIDGSSAQLESTHIIHVGVKIVDGDGFVVADEAWIRGFLLRGGQHSLVNHSAHDGVTEELGIMESHILSFHFREAHINGKVPQIGFHIVGKAGAIPIGSALFSDEFSLGGIVSACDVHYHQAVLDRVAQ